MESIMRRQPTAKYWITKLALQPHPEGGYFREIYRAAEQIPSAALPARYRGPRSFSTSIYYLLAGTQISTLHRLTSDEQWHFYDGGALLLAMIAPDGTSREMRLGRDQDWTRTAAILASTPGRLIETGASAHWCRLSTAFCTPRS